MRSRGEVRSPNWAELRSWNYELWIMMGCIAIRSAGIAIRWLRIAIRWRGIRSGGGENWSFFVRFWLCGGVSAWYVMCCDFGINRIGEILRGYLFSEFTCLLCLFSDWCFYHFFMRFYHFFMPSLWIRSHRFAILRVRFAIF